MQIGLTLSGGGVKGAAHIGVLMALEEENIKVSAISGTSSGSIVAALYSCGYTPREIYYIFKKYCNCITDYNHLIPFKMLGTIFTGKISLKSLAKGKNIEYIVNYFTSKKGIVDITECLIPIAIPAVDIVNGEIVYYLSKRIDVTNRENTTYFEDNPEYILGGKLSNIIRASTAFPGVFEPKRIGRHLLVDGGLKVNSPVSIVKKLNCSLERQIVIYFEKVDNNRIPKNIVETSVKALDIMSHGINSDEINKADYRIDIESSNVSLLDMSKIDYMTTLGYKITKKYIKDNIK